MDAVINRWKTAWGSAGVQPTVYGSQPFVSGKEAVVRNPAVYRCNSMSFSYPYVEIICRGFVACPGFYYEYSIPTSLDNLSD